MPSPRDLEIARLLGWYRIPLRRAPKTISVDAVAFYHTAAFDSEKWGIYYTAPVLGHELTTRAELLRDEPAHPRAGEQYYKLQLGALERLPRPIPSARWRRLTFFYTTGERLQSANEINDLMIGTEERELLWTALKERGYRPEKDYLAEDNVLAELAILCKLGTLAISVHNDNAPPRAEGELIVPALSIRGEAGQLSQLLDDIEEAVGKRGGESDD